ncbi:putative N6-adenosine-methyltransferase MT-A70-like [Aristolochia californica]|uniref:putative N6-adenosine-methyltransferase MT-A70-like n=1 Tax=Aristolochia californica TaxID=171875 RepID=UPI0035DBA551
MESAQMEKNDGKDSLKQMRHQIQEEMLSLKEMRQQLQDRIESRQLDQQTLISSVRALVPDIVSSLDLSLRLVSAFNGRGYTPSPNPVENHSSRQKILHKPISPTTVTHNSSKPFSGLSPNWSRQDGDKSSSDGADPLSVVRSMVAVCLLERVPFTDVDSAAVLRKLEGDPSATPAEKTALLELGGEAGAISAVETALRAIAADTGAVDLEDFVVSGKSRIMVMGIDRTRLLKELPESSQLPQAESKSVEATQSNPTAGVDVNASSFGLARPPVQDIWMGPGDPHLSGLPPMLPGGVGPRGGPRAMGLMGMPRAMGVSPLHRPPLASVGGPTWKPKTEEDEMKDLEALINKKSFRELQKSKTGEELLDLIHRPTAKETAVAAKFKTKGGSQLKEYCSSLTKEDCRLQKSSFIACEKVHFRRIIAPHTDINLGDCSFLDTCRHMKTCKYVHYELDPTQDVPPMLMGSGSLPAPKPIKPQRAEYCSEVELGESQWINCDIRNFRMDILGQFGVIMADPPWDIHMELPYGTMADDEMRNLNVPVLQTDGLIFLWVTGRAMELGRECLELWGYKRVEEIIWVKTNQLQRIIRTGRTGHWLNHSKEHCLVGIKGNPEVNRNIDTDVIVAEVRETSRKPDEMYPMLERISPRTRKLELFARMHNTHCGWMSLGNQLQGVRLVDEGLRARFKAAYPDVEVQPPSPPRSSSMDVDSNVTAQMRSPFVGLEPKSPSVATESFTAEQKPMSADVEMLG